MTRHLAKSTFDVEVRVDISGDSACEEEEEEEEGIQAYHAVRESADVFLCW